MSEEPQKPRTSTPIPLYYQDSLQDYLRRADAWLAEAHDPDGIEIPLTTQIKEPLARARTPFQEVREVQPDWHSLTSGDWVAMKELKEQLYERRGE